MTRPRQSFEPAAIQFTLEFDCMHSIICSQCYTLLLPRYSAMNSVKMSVSMKVFIIMLRF